MKTTEVRPGAHCAPISSPSNGINIGRCSVSQSRSFIWAINPNPKVISMFIKMFAKIVCLLLIVPVAVLAQSPFSACKCCVCLHCESWISIKKFSRHRNQVKVAKPFRPLFAWKIAIMTTVLCDVVRLQRFSWHSKQLPHFRRQRVKCEHFSLASGPISHWARRGLFATIYPMVNVHLRPVQVLRTVWTFAFHLVYQSMDGCSLKYVWPTNRIKASHAHVSAFWFNKKKMGFEKNRIDFNKLLSINDENWRCVSFNSAAFAALRTWRHGKR